MVHRLLHISAIGLHEQRALDRDPVALEVVLGGEYGKVDPLVVGHRVARDIDVQLGWREGDLYLCRRSLVA